MVVPAEQQRVPAGHDPGPPSAAVVTQSWPSGVASAVPVPASGGGASAAGRASAPAGGAPSGPGVLPLPQPTAKIAIQSQRMTGWYAIGSATTTCVS